MSLYFISLSLSISLLSSLPYHYKLSIHKNKVPSLSISNKYNTGFSNCLFTFNPSLLYPYYNPYDNSSNNTKSMMIVRVSQCPDLYGGTLDHLLYTLCDNIDGTCEDIKSEPFHFKETVVEDPRTFYYDSYYYMYYYAKPPLDHQINSVFLRRTKTPLNISSWELVVSELPWIRNGCVIIRDDGYHYVIYGLSNGDSNGPLPGIGIAMTTDFITYKYINRTWLVPLGPNNIDEPEIVLEAASNVVTLSTGDYLHIYAAGTPGWVINGNYTAGYIILDKNDPTNIIQRSVTHLFIPTMDYEIGDGIYPVQRYRTLFVTSIVPMDNEIDTFRVWYGAADANVATAILKVTYD